MDSRDEALFKKAAAGDIDAFSSFIENYEKLIYNASYRMLPNSHDAEDISQEVIIKVYRNISTCKSYASFKSWLFRIINNTCIDEIRKRKNKQTLSLDASQDSEKSYTKDIADKNEKTPEIQYLEKDRMKEIQNAINRLSPQYRSVIILRDINGFSYEQVAQITKLNLGTVKSRIARARSALRKELTSEKD